MLTLSFFNFSKSFGFSAKAIPSQWDLIFFCEVATWDLCTLGENRGKKRADRIYYGYFKTQNFAEGPLEYSIKNIQILLWNNFFQLLLENWFLLFDFRKVLKILQEIGRNWGEELGIEVRMKVPFQERGRQPCGNVFHLPMISTALLFQKSIF